MLALAQWGLRAAYGVEGHGSTGRVQEVAAYNTACNEYHGRQSKHNTTSHSSSHTLALEYSAFPANTAQLLKCLNTDFLTSLKKKKSLAGDGIVSMNKQ